MKTGVTKEQLVKSLGETLSLTPRRYKPFGIKG